MELKQLKETPPWEWPEGTAEVLLKALRDPTAADRDIAAELAGDATVVCDDLVDALLSVAGDEKMAPELRAQAAVSCGPALELGETDGFDEPFGAPISEAAFKRIQKTLRTMYNDERAGELVRRRALEASVRATEEWHKQAVQKALGSSEPDWVLTAVFCMQYVPGFNREILAALDSKDARVFFYATVAAGAREIKEAWGRIEPLLNEATEKELLLAAIEAASTVAPEEAAEKLEQLADSEDEEIAEAASEALAFSAAMSAEGDLDEEE